MPKEWRALRDQELSDAAKIPGAVFCHASGFTGGHSTEEGAKRMAEAAVNAAPSAEGVGSG